MFPKLLRWIIPVVVLPGSALIFIPAFVIWRTRDTKWAAGFTGMDSWQFWVALLLSIPGFVLALSAMAMFFRTGEGTLAHWDPPRRLVVRGPYRWVRNPMLSGIIILLFALSLLLVSWPLALWAGLFFLGNAIFFPLFEEPILRRRFGDDYQAYCRNVPRWIPRIRPWNPRGSNDGMEPSQG